MQCLDKGGVNLVVGHGRLQKVPQPLAGAALVADKEDGLLPGSLPPGARLLRLARLVLVGLGLVGEPVAVQFLETPLRERAVELLGVVSHLVAVLDVVGQVLGVEHLLAALHVGGHGQLGQVLAHKLRLQPLPRLGKEALCKTSARFVGTDDQVVFDGARACHLLHRSLFLVQCHYLSHNKASP